MKKLDDFDKTMHKLSDKVRVVIFFDDTKIDTIAEELKMATRLKKHDCLLPFKLHAREMFEAFNSRQQ